ncbi:MAG TPA: hypothetical protein DIW43_02215 [Spongiibacteraceae bacterium]|nr:hypothetical protein [Spongiibacteraceae bacterium]HCS26237.1 hypothetical protein [Spongiibacteraceae bacterium]
MYSSAFAKFRLSALGIALLGSATHAVSDAVVDAITSGKSFGDFRLRYENVAQDNTLKDASALTLRTRLGYTTGAYSNFSATVEFEDVRVVAGRDSFSVPPTGFKTGRFSVIADPEVTELDQGFVQYKNDLVTARLGRQVVSYDGHRFVGHVGWRQDRQTFDAMRVDLSPAKGVAFSYSYVDQRNGIFAEVRDQDSKDHLLNAAFETPLGKLVVYGYLLELDNNTDNSLDTYGFSLSGSKPLENTRLLYTIEYASQEFELGALERNAEYKFAEGGVVISGITIKASYESLGSDDGTYGFSTPLATLHKFNGWADVFLNTPAVGLVDTYATLSGPLAGGNWSVVYHRFKADERAPAINDLGRELDISYARKFGKHYNAGIKYAAFSAGDVAVDTDKIWAWVGLTF